MITYLSGLSERVVGNPTEEERKKLIDEGYKFESINKVQYIPPVKDKVEIYEIWTKQRK